MIGILGGGITAVAAALQLKKAGKDFILLEAEDRLGGKIRSIQKEGYTLELGPNTVLINNPETEALLKELDLWKELIFADKKAVKNRFVLKKNRPEPIPNSLGKIFSSKLFGLNTFFSILKEPFVKGKADEKEESLADFSRRRFGSQILDDFITPFISGIYAGDPERMSVDHTLSILKEAEQLKGSVIKGMGKAIKQRKRGTPSGWKAPANKIFSFKNGLETIFQKAQERLGDKVVLNAKVKAILAEKESYWITYEKEGSQRRVEVDQLISTLPSNCLVDLLPESIMKNQLMKVNYVPAIVCHIGIKKEQLIFKQKAFGILSRKFERVPFLGVLLNSHFFPHQSPQGEFLITVISGGYRNPNLMDKSDETILEEITASLRQLKIIEGKPKFNHVYKWQAAIPQYELGYSEILRSMEEFESKFQGIHFAGNYRNGISVSDCIANGTNLANKIS